VVQPQSEYYNMDGSLRLVGSGAAGAMEQPTMLLSSLLISAAAAMIL
jgi:hypothetical protein